MTNPLTPARFAELAEAYGSVIAREPAMQAILAEAEWLDARLDAWRVPAPSPALRDRVVASRRVALLRRARLWWSGIGIATALAGAVAGSVGVAVAMPSDHAIADEATAFGDLTAQEH
jgi:hypothetical protein